MVGRKGFRGPGFEGPRVADGYKQIAASQPSSILASQHNKSFSGLDCRLLGALRSRLSTTLQPLLAF